MSSSETPELLEQAPEWWSESVLGLSVAFAGVVGMSLGSAAIGRVAGILAGSGGPSGRAFEAVLPYAAALLLLALVNAAVGLGVTYAYLTYRDLESGLVVDWPDREAGRWLAALAVLAAALVLGSTLVLGVLGYTGPDPTLNVPSAFVAPQPFTSGLSLRGVPPLVGGALSIAALAGVVGPSLAALFHGVLQNSLRRVAPAAVAVGATALAAALLAGGTDPVGSAVVAAVVAAAGYAYERTGNLAVPMAAYAVLNAVTLTAALLLVFPATGQL